LAIYENHFIRPSAAGRISPFVFHLYGLRDGVKISP